MTRTRKTIVIFMTLTILCSLFVVVFATTNINLEDMTTTPTVNPFEYANTPEGLYVFLYYGTSPYTSVDIDTSECVVGRLYVYNSTTGSVTEISEQTVTVYSYTQTALYYVTSDQKIYKTDYTGTNHEHLYQCTQGTIRNLKNFLDSLYFIEDQNSIMLLDVASKTAQQIWEYETLDWAIMLNTSQLIATTADDDNYLYDIPTNTATLISSIEATNLVTAAVMGIAPNNARMTTTANFSDIVLTQENDISFPLPAYPAVPDGYFDPNLPQYSGPSSWFHKNDAEGCNGSSNCRYYAEARQCMGFARYVHDVYLHIDDEDITDWAWKNTPCITEYEAPKGEMEDNPVADADPTKLKLFNGDEQLIKEFFNQLNTGAYVRYGKYKDTTRADGCHSIVLIAKDDTGIWAYECNQDYVVNDPNNYYGCGVFIQYYTYVDLDKYEFITSYVNHNFEDGPDYDGPDYDGPDYHQKGCTACGGYVRQKHNNVSATLMTRLKHYATFNCCNGVSATTSHTGTVLYSNYSTTQHEVTATCCSGYILSAHTFVLNSNNRYICTGCGKDRDINVIGPTSGFGEPVIAVASKE